MLSIIDPPSKKKKKELNNRPFKFLFIYLLFIFVTGNSTGKFFIVELWMWNSNPLIPKID